jgi:site-specific DNA recombinase
VERFVRQSCGAIRRGPSLHDTSVGPFRCGECGCVVTTETQKGHNYLRCTKRVKRDCSQPYVREESVHEQIVDTLRRFSLTGEEADWIVLELQAEREQSGRRDDAFVHTMQAEVRTAEAKLDRLMGRTLDGSLV